MARKPATYEDLLAAPDDVIAEIIDGELVTSPRPAPRHSHTAVRLTMALGGPFDAGRGGPGGWLLLFEPEVHLAPDVLVPDLAGWRRERLPALPDSAYLTLPPDWVCEILSPSTERLDRARKLKIYAREGISHVWLVNPRTRVLEVLRLEGTSWTLAATHDADSASITAEPFDAVPLHLEDIWPSLPEGR